MADTILGPRCKPGILGSPSPRFSTQAYCSCANHIHTADMSFLKGWFGGSDSKTADSQQTTSGKTSDAWRSTFSPGRNPNMKSVGRDYYDHAEDGKSATTWQMVLKSAQVKQFQDLDANADGFIDAKDLEKHLGRSSGVAALIKEADKNNDGKIDYQEFTDMLKNQHK